MLVLTRYADQSFVVRLPDGRLVVVTVVRVAGDAVRLGITADRDIPVVRSELLHSGRDAAGEG